MLPEYINNTRFEDWKSEQEESGFYEFCPEILVLF
jgi:hypothetical protein